MELLSGNCSYFIITNGLKLPFNKLNRHLEVKTLLYCYVLYLV